MPIPDLIRWFAENRMRYMFRQKRSPYRVWISEVILQQTRIKTALDTIETFLQRFPTTKDLAAANEESVLRAFRGLGYYRRAILLQKGARFIEKHHNGRFPNTYEELLNIPSIGPYTAAAVASICFAEKRLSLDGNIARVLARYYRIDGHIHHRPFVAAAYDIASKDLFGAPFHPGDINEALMELGQRICTKEPICPQCPIRQNCSARIGHIVDAYPTTRPRRKKASLIIKMYIAIYDGQIVLSKVSGQSPVLKGHLGFPFRYQINDKPAGYSDAIARQWEQEFGAEPISGRYPHSIMHYGINVSVVRIALDQWPEATEGDRLRICTSDEVPTKLAASFFLKAWKIGQPHRGEPHRGEPHRGDH